ncbi:DNA-binding transcriptional MerR regulator [Allocatelliglobosispora scoriae]|uniref:DNA-binding transcriptional MerR regulator n=1 Tax=Allocatelliglobosispora scoriae TaxID=643052 RepID=A0A841C4R1_9ACTN|nr:MerR family transcriptional regulator [Allocatelliglobosispora scoriae]MBB5874052.1 DNA-binding transcriptional MerR regulator [Allocatelliglobosispora scoriae]
MSIGEVLAELRAEFPDTTISKLRFLESEGLVEPRRTAAGYRKYTRTDVLRLRYVLTAQRDHYLPLRVIREQLAAGAAEEGDDEPPAAVVSSIRPALVALGPHDDPPVIPAEKTARLSAVELCARAGITEALLRDLQTHGLIRVTPGEWFDAEALAIAEVAGQFAAYGVQPRHLRAWRAAADREVGVVAQLVAPILRQQDPSAQARADEAVRELTALSQRLHSALVRIGLRESR